MKKLKYRSILFSMLFVVSIFPELLSANIANIKFLALESTGEVKMKFSSEVMYNSAVYKIQVNRQNYNLQNSILNGKKSLEEDQFETTFKISEIQNSDVLIIQILELIKESEYIVLDSLFVASSKQSPYVSTEDWDYYCSSVFIESKWAFHNSLSNHAFKESYSNLPRIVDTCKSSKNELISKWFFRLPQDQNAWVVSRNYFRYLSRRDHYKLKFLEEGSSSRSDSDTMQSKQLKDYKIISSSSNLKKFSINLAKWNINKNKFLAKLIYENGKFIKTIKLLHKDESRYSISFKQKRKGIYILYWKISGKSYKYYLVLR